MTASHIQVLRAGPVQPIGLPPTAAAMGVTNARVLHRRMLNNSQVSNSRNNNSLGLLGAKRCLFGSPEPGEIQNLYEEEMKRNRDRFIERYNYDILSDRFVGDGALKNTSPSFSERADHPETAEQSSCNRHEEAVEDRLREDQNPSSSDRTSSATKTTKTVKTTTTPPSCCSSTGCGSECDTKCNLDEIQLLTITKDSCEATTATTVPTIIKKIAPPPPIQSGSPIASPTFKDKKSCERLKPYSRQNFITEYYNVRKTVTLQSIPHAIEVSQLPTPQKAKLCVHEQQRFQNCEDI